MVWHSPFTFTAGQPLSYSQINDYLFDNMQATIGARLKTDLAGTGAGAWLTTDDVNSAVPRKISGVRTASEISLNPPSPLNVYTDVTGFSPSPYRVSTITGTRALVIIAATNLSHQITTGSEPTIRAASSRLSFKVTGATPTIDSSDARSLRRSGYFPFSTGGGTPVTPLMGTFHVTGLTPGSNTFTMQVKWPVNAVNGTLSRPSMTVIPLG